jgi:hypothetical protein
MSKENRVAGFNKNTGVGMGLLCLIPFGWIFLLASIIRRKNDVIKYGTLSVGLALTILHNYIVSFTIVTVLVVIACLASWNNGGEILIPNIIAIIIIVVVYNVEVEKILRFGEEGQPNKQDDDIKTQLRELKEQNSKQASIIEKLEKEIKKQEK